MFTTLVLLATIRVGTAVRSRCRADPAGRASRDRGQATAEYALVLVAAGTIATLVIAWAASTNRISSLMDTVLRSVTGLVA